MFSLFQLKSLFKYDFQTYPYWNDVTIINTEVIKRSSCCYESKMTSNNKVSDYHINITS